MGKLKDLGELLGFTNINDPAPRPRPLPRPDERGNRAHRPRDLRNMVGQDEARIRIVTAIAGARARRQVPQHFLLSGPPGLGKTSLAELVAGETRGQLVAVLGSQLNTPAALVQVVGRLRRNFVDTLFIDEVHGLNAKIMEMLYLALEDGEFTVSTGRGEGASVETVKVPPFICVAATTLPGELTQPFRNRFKTQITLSFYSETDIGTIICQYLQKDGGELEPDAAADLARRSRGTPRIAQGLATAAWDYAIAVRGADTKLVTESDVDAALELQGIDAFGMGLNDRRVLMAHAQRKGRPMGAKSAGQTTGLTTSEVESVVEPFLIHSGFIRLTERGRRITLLGFAALGIEPPTGFNDEAILADGWVDT